MKRFRLQILITLLAALAVVTQSPAQSIWSTGYYAGWMQGNANDGYLPAQNIDFGALTHVVHFSLVPKSDGTLNDWSNGITQANSSALIQSAHAAGKKVIVSVGGWSSDVPFRSATSATNRARFITNLVSFMKTRGYDGIDIDWETLQASDATLYLAFIAELRTALNAVTPRPLLTAAVTWQASVIGSAQQHFDQINIMSYDMAGAWSGWVSWHNSPIYDGGVRFPSTGGAVPSTNSLVDQFVAAGVPKSKLGIGIDFYGYIWSGGSGTSTGGVTRPGQSWSVAPAVQDNVPYSTIMQNHFQSQYARWDTGAQAAYLSIDQTGSTGDKFISYDNEETCRKKIQYARAKGLGGVIIWELGGGYRASMPEGQRDLLLQSVKQALAGSVTGGSDTTRPSVTITSPAEGTVLSGTAVVTVTATDDGTIAGVRFTIDGSAIGGEDITSPYTLSFNTSTYSNGTHTVRATARDAAGNTSSAERVVSIINSNTAISSSEWIAREGLLSPWINASWSATISFASAEQAYAGISSMKVVQAPFGGLSLHNGPWDAPLNIDAAKYDSVSFHVFATTSTASLALLLESDLGATFPTIAYGTVPSGRWVKVSVPVSALNPQKLAAHRLDIMDISGIASTYYIDELRLIDAAPALAPTVPTLISPVNGAKNVIKTPSLSWNPSANATSYRVQISRDVNFVTTILDRSGLTATTFVVGAKLTRGTIYYWRVLAINPAGQSAWSVVYSFQVSGSVTQPIVASKARSVQSLPSEYELAQNFPNPFNPSTTLKYQLPAASRVSINVYTIHGQLLETLVDEEQPAGYNSVTWNAGSSPSGTYLCRIDARSLEDPSVSFSQIRKMSLTK